MRRKWLCGVVIGVCCVGAAAEESARQPNLATPKSAALEFVRAMEADSMPAFQAVTIGNEEDYKLFVPLVGMVGAAKQVEKAARQKFGRAGRAVVRSSPAVELEVHVQESDVKVTGDSAVLRHKGQEDADPLTLKKTSEGWKVDLTAIPNRQQMANAAVGMQKMQEALAQSASDIRSGKFKSAEEAEQALIKRMQEAGAAAAAAEQPGKGK